MPLFETSTTHVYALQLDGPAPQLSFTADTYTHVLLDDREVDYRRVLAESV